jgi:hypothetical protein
MGSLPRSRHVLQRQNMAWPTVREDQGHGVVVVVVAVTRHQGARERRAQGEARQVVGVREPCGTRDAESQSGSTT